MHCVLQSFLHTEKYFPNLVFPNYFGSTKFRKYFCRSHIYYIERKRILLRYNYGNCCVCYFFVRLVKEIIVHILGLIIIKTIIKKLLFVCLSVYLSRSYGCSDKNKIATKNAKIAILKKMKKRFG